LSYRNKAIIGASVLACVAAGSLALGSGALPASAAEADPAPCTGPVWSDTKIYLLGTAVSYDGREYVAKWWTQGDLPARPQGIDNAWSDRGLCGGSTPGVCAYLPWDASIGYLKDDVVSFKERAYLASRSTSDWPPDSDSTNGPWEDLGPC
jgi:chitinase